MGNQLFQYAFIKSLSEKLHTSFYVNEKLGPFIAADFFDLEGYHPLINPLKRLLLKLQHEQPFRALQSVEISDYHESEMAQLADRKIYRGYFQSAAFFKDIAREISTYIRVKQTYRDEFSRMYGNLFSSKRVIAVHIRRGDYLNLNDWWLQNLGGNNLTLPASYYEACIEKAGITKDDVLIFVSDDPEFVRCEFAHLPNSLFVNNSAIIDFQIIMYADVCIIANSSFAWWAAYLNPKKEKQIFCPRYWLGFKIKKEYPVNIIPAEWVQVDVGGDHTT